jgi:CheY-like chemotaxis protein
MNTDASSQSQQTGKHTVLLIDDEQMVLEVGKAILQRLGHEVVTAESGEEALEKFDHHQDAIGCVVLDLTMPGMDGKETFSRLRDLAPGLPIIISSGLSAEQVSAQFEDGPTIAFIQKPYQVAELSSTIQSILKNDA